MKTRKISAVLLSAVMLASAFGLSSCGGEESNTLQILAESSYVDTEQLDAYAETFSDGSAALAAAGKTAEFTGLSVGTEDGAPTVYAASTMKADAMIAANEVDMMLCSLDEAARNARGEYYYSLEELFTPEELAQIPEEDLLSFDLVDEERHPRRRIRSVYCWQHRRPGSCKRGILGNCQRVVTDKSPCWYPDW